MEKTFITRNKTSFVPKGQTNKFVTLILIVTLMLAMGSLGGFIVVVYANPAPSSSMYVEGGIYPSIPNFKFWREDSTYYAKDQNGQIPSWGESSNACALITNAIPYMPIGKWGEPTGVMSLDADEFSISATIDLGQSSIELRGAGQWATRLIPTSGTFNVINIGNGTRTHNTAIRDLGIDGDDTGASHGIYMYEARKVRLDNLEIRDMGGYGILLNSSMINRITHTRVFSCENGIGLINSTYRSNGNQITGGSVINCATVGVNITDSQGNTVDMDIEGCGTGIWIGGDGLSHWNKVYGWFEGNTLDIHVENGTSNRLSPSVFYTFTDTAVRSYWRPLEQREFWLSGQTTFPNGATSYSWTHGMMGTPNRIQITWAGDVGQDRYWWTANSTHITLTLGGAAGAATPFSWLAEYQP